MEQQRRDSFIRHVGPVLTVALAAEILGVTPETVCGYIRRGELIATWLGTDENGIPCPPYAILAEDLFDFICARRVKPRKSVEVRPAPQLIPPAVSPARRRRAKVTKLVEVRARKPAAKSASKRRVGGAD